MDIGDSVAELIRAAIVVDRDDMGWDRYYKAQDDLNKAIDKLIETKVKEMTASFLK